MQKQFQKFMQDIDERLQKSNLILDNYIIDHICFRVSCKEDFEKYKESFKKISILYAPSFFNGRNFMFFLLKEPLVYKNHKIYHVEFPEPGGSHEYQNGFQHIEILTKNIKDTNSIAGCGKKQIKRDDNTAIKVTTSPTFSRILTETGGEIKYC